VALGGGSVRLEEFVALQEWQREGAEVEMMVA
jgi:hypothetical protein